MASSADAGRLVVRGMDLVEAPEQTCGSEPLLSLWLLSGTRPAGTSMHSLLSVRRMLDMDLIKRPGRRAAAGRG